MAENGRNIWFPAKTYGWGWGLPCTWQGWVVMIAYVGLVILAVFVIRPNQHTEQFLAVAGGLSILFVLICWWKGERPSWRWGDKK